MSDHPPPSELDRNGKERQHRRKVYLPAGVIGEMLEEARRLDLSVSRIAQEAWKLYRAEERPIVPKREAPVGNRARVSVGEAWTSSIPAYDFLGLKLKRDGGRRLPREYAAKPGMTVEQYLMSFREAWAKQERILAGPKCGWRVE